MQGEKLQRDAIVLFQKIGGSQGSGTTTTMIDWSTTQLLLVVNAYVFLALAACALSGSDLLCLLTKEVRCARRHRLAKFFVAGPLVLSCLALLFIGLFVVGMSHGSQPKAYQVALFIAGCLTPCFLLTFWVFGSFAVDVLWCLLTCLLLAYFSFVNPALYIRYWADDNYQWAQMWMARHYETGGGGLDKLESSARTWYQKAAENGNMEAQYRIAQLQRRGESSRKWYLMASEQGHTGAMVHLARLAGSKEERQKWLKLAAANYNPEALFMLAEDAMSTDLPAARRLILEAAEKRSRSAIVLLIDQYLQGGILFDRDETLADSWQAILEKTPAADTEAQFFTAASIDRTLTSGRAAGRKIRAGDPDTLFTKAKNFLAQPAKDEILHDRAITYLKRAVDSNHIEAAVLLAKLAGEKSEAGMVSPETLGWLEIAATGDNVYALKELTRYYKSKPEANLDDLGKSLEYNRRLLQVMAAGTGDRMLSQRQHWRGEYRDTIRQQAQLKRLGGSWQTAISEAANNPDDEYLLAKEMIASTQYNNGMRRMQSAAQRGSPAARFELAHRVLRGPRSFDQEIHAISELQELDRLNFLPASYQLGMLYQSGTGVVPKNFFLARRLFRKSRNDEALRKKAEHMLESIPAFTDSLQLTAGKNIHQQIIRWYKNTKNETGGSALLQQQFETLLDHYSDIGELTDQAEKNDGLAQYNLAQSLQSHNLEEAVQWLKRAAANGCSMAQYELALRMIRSKKNPEQTLQEMRKWAISAAASGHVGALVFIAANHKDGRGGFEKNSALAKHYYQLALQANDNDILFEGKIAGRLLSISRSAVLNSEQSLLNKP